ncbi:LysR family transcriptional regulator [Azospirillum rugosum]|uniref:DNA-binding transcriptional LysR family regulator n=1 Tax=Azospirillum rugosum TaxID=416170 RepID=A0ABS4SLH9_9PROT|nr:LysR family transcriptional regulator [Azospirillum rugosum]MBP2293409.1 DNA-binding transcriptional LysR family regulator [Azospirillum rugosum]
MPIPDRSHDLLAFLRTAESGSFTGAARQLGTTPSSVSKSVARLERQLGVRLFHRSTRSLALTAEAAAYAERVAPLLRAIEDAGDILQPGRTAQGLLRVTMPSDLGTALMEPLAREILGRNAGLKLDVSLTDRHVDLIREGYDVALRAGVLANTELVARPLGALPMVLVASPAYLAEHGVPQTIAALRTHAHVRYTLAGRPFPITFADGSSFTPEGVLDTDSGAGLRGAALAGVGIAQVMRVAVQAELEAGRLRVVLPEAPLPAVPVQALHAFARHPPLRVRLFIDFAAARVAALAAAGTLQPGPA